MLYAAAMFALKLLLGFVALLIVGVAFMWLGFAIVHNWQGGD